MTDPIAALIASKHRTFVYPDKPCGQCGISIKPKTGTQKFCEPCAVDRSRKRRTAWAGNAYANDPEGFQQKAAKERRAIKGVTRDAGKINSVDQSIATIGEKPDYAWLVRIRFPFSYDGSKNRTTSMANDHLYLSKSVRKYRDAIAYKMKAALVQQKISIKSNKLWVSMHVEKSDHRGDAINFVDTVCDALKMITGLDDRWFCIGFVDWSINKKDPALLIQLAQEDVPDVQACSVCGRLLEYHHFTKHKTSMRGISRECIECMKLCRSLAKEKKCNSQK